MDVTFSPQPKPSKTRKQLKAQRDRLEAKVLKEVRAAVFLRDGGCRMLKSVAHPDHLMAFAGLCYGPLTLAHLRRRSATRKMAPTVRHRVDEAVCLCLRHHEMEERYQLVWSYETPEKANGWMQWRRV